ncbi:MAG: hypothetical protein CME70_12305 [Halobacteriovorax sp.]|nr:hypothetical protein [Halobacteriovorax sp.]|tara:strand:- start:266066 stop:266350 length:285 start_codon:yes stop_codon:yes gene_type:complete
MRTVRKFKKMGLWDFIDLMKENCFGCADKETYFTYLDELRMRRIESISEGGNYKLASLAKELKLELEKEREKNSNFLKEEELKEFDFIVEEICH